MNNEDIGAGIKERETRFVKDDDGKEHLVRDAITYGVLDPRWFANEGGTPIDAAEPVEQRAGPRGTRASKARTEPRVGCA